MEHYYAESPSDHKRTISLNLADLKSDSENIHNPNVQTYTRERKVTTSITNPDEFLRRSIREISNQESNYQENFSVLLSKSKGTKYEPVLRKLLNMDCVDITYSPHKSRGNSTILKANQQDDAVLTHEIREEVPVKKSMYEQQEALKHLAKPLDRKLWQVVAVVRLRNSFDLKYLHLRDLP